MVKAKFWLTIYQFVLSNLDSILTLKITKNRENRGFFNLASKPTKELASVTFVFKIDTLLPDLSSKVTLVLFMDAKSTGKET